MFASDKMKIGLICMLSIFISACSSSPEFTAKSGGPGRVLLSAYYGDLLLQIYDKNVDASWRLDVESSSMTINGTKFQLRSAKRQEYVTKQNGFAYFIYLQDDDLTEGEYLVEAVLLKGDDSRRYTASYEMEVKSISLLDYLYAIYKQRTS